jgi:hypothetical protein
MMFKYTPKILAHISSLKTSNFVVPEYILNQSDSANTVNLFHRHCPHRRYPLADPGTHVDNITCKFHDFQWDKNGVPLNNNKKLSCGTATVGKSGLVFKDFVEPDHRWVNDLSNEKNLVYSHSVQGSSHGSWLWLMDAEADLLHVYKNGIHPFLSQQIDINDLTLDQGEGWILQTHPTGWWLYIFPFVFVEYGNPGMLMVNHVVPQNKNSEYGFDYITQFYYDPTVSGERRMIFETLDQVFKEDIAATEKQKGNYFPLMTAVNKFEDHCVHFGNWYKENKLSND